MDRPRVWCVLLPVVALALLIAATASAELKISGYTQIRFADTSIDEDDYEFDLKRCNIAISGPINEDGTEVKLQVDLGKLDDDDGEISLQDAIITHPLSAEWKVRVGYSDMLFGYDVPYSSSRRLPFERAQATRQLFPGEKDTGVYCTYAPQNAGNGTPSVILGYSNDLENTADWFDTHDQSYAFVAGLRWDLANKGQAGISYMSANREGELGGVATEWDDSVWGAHVRYNSSSNFAFQGEYFDGKRREVDVNGWYGTLEFKPNNSNATCFYRYDTYDNGAASNSDYDRHTLGVAIEAGSQSRITLQYEDIDDRGTSGNNFGLQWQVMYPAKK